MKKLSKTEWTFSIFIVLALALVTAPFWLWFIEPEKKLHVLIIDKTVPDTSYREHKGLTWLLNNQRYVKPDGTTYSAERDYIGFQPDGNTWRSMPESVNDYDLIYLSDQYGVYQNDLEPKKNDNEKLYGGLTMTEIDELNKGLQSKKHKTLIAEFNTFASPTQTAAREQMSNILNVDWTGWTGRYFEHLENKEVPNWLKENYQQSNGKKWSFTGAGIVFINQNGIISVVRKNEMKTEGLEFLLTTHGKKFFDKDLHSTYKYWFDIVAQRNQNEVLANYKLNVNDTASARLKRLGIPLQFPAIVHHMNAQYNSYYFAGDFADEKEVPQIYQTRVLNEWKKYVGARNSFYWTTYVPLMEEILDKGLYKVSSQERVEVDKKDGISVNSKTDNRYIQVLKNGKWQAVLVKGVNMGIAKPDAFPGQTAIKKEEYLRWFKQIGEMNANAIRVYTLHPPGFYEALKEYNETAEKPLYLFHGIWVNEEDLVSEQNAFSNKLTKEFKNDISLVVDAIHGNADIESRPGHASGKYKNDVSQYLLGYIIGIEWDPEAVHQTNIKNANVTSYDGTYFKADRASPFENWLAEMMDYTTSYETNKYKWQHSMSFTNWPTTDLLKHSAEPSATEDMVSINPNNIKTKSTFHAGMFASYHIYPYYPDFMNYEKKYLSYKDADGKNNNYEGYLNDLIKKHDLPVLVAEFGVPGSRGLTHNNPSGFNQGFLSEQEQGNINQKLFQSILDQKYAGGLVFTWQDEWFKRTWNTMDFDNPDRRPFWSNVQTNEQHFGMLAFEPGKSGETIYPDGSDFDWNKNNITPFYQGKEKQSPLKQLYVTSDEAYVHIKLNFSKAINWDQQRTLLLFDTIPGQGQSKVRLDRNQLITIDSGIDFVADLKGPDQSKLLIDSYYDSFYYLYAEKLDMIPKVPYAGKKDSGYFHPIRLALNKAMTIPTTNQMIPFHSYETGKLKFGNGNPSSKDYNSLTDISFSKDKKTIELRMPWQLLNIKDPSLKEAMGDIWKKGLEASISIPGIKIAAISYNDGKPSGSLPAGVEGDIPSQDIKTYEWNPWEQASYHERFKESYYIMQNAYKNASITGEEQ
ncbi:hypothetical protein [Peribacillus sp. SCS-155]|uniref:hypothetical protein n=1 Tax=Peribacillus sedimenti TaxID=3115297 RepID=UPI003906472C